MQRKISVRVLASMIVSALLFVLPIGSIIANNTMATPVFAEGSVSDDQNNNDNCATIEHPSDEASTEAGTEENTEESPEEPSEEEPDECICTDKCGEYNYNHNCPVCSRDYTACEYEMPNVKISINIPDGWYPRGTTVNTHFKVEDIADTDNFAIKTVKAKIGQNGNYEDVTESMKLAVNENCTVYVLVTDANNRSYERSRAVTCFDTTKPTLNAAISEGLLTIQAVDNESGVKLVYVNGYEFTDVTNGTINIRLKKFDAGYEYFNISAMDNAGNVSEVYKTKNPYYKDPSEKSNDNEDPAKQLPSSAEATQPSTATAPVTSHVKVDENGNMQLPAPAVSNNNSLESQKKAELKKADATASDSEVDETKGKEFYTVTAASGKNFYLVIDRDGQDEMVYFLTEITENDLLNVTTDNSQTLPKNSAALESQITVSESALPNNNTDVDNTHEVETPTEVPTEAPTEEVEETEPEENGSSAIGYIFIALIGAGAIGTAYYVKIVKKKEDDFVEDEDDEEEEETFNEDDEQKEEDFFEKNNDESVKTTDEKSESNEPENTKASETTENGDKA